MFQEKLQTKSQLILKRLVLFDFINLTQVHNFTVSAQDIFYLPSTFGIYRKFYRNSASTNEIMKRFALSY